MQKPTVAKVNPDLECSVCSRHLQHFIKTVLRNVLTSHSNKFQSINVFVDCVRSQLHAQLKPGHSHNAKQWSRHRHKLTSDNQWLSSSAFMLINVTFQSRKWIIGFYKLPALCLLKQLHHLEFVSCLFASLWFWLSMVDPMMACA